MKNIVHNSEGNNYSAIDIGQFKDLKQYSYPHPKLNQNIQGKVFVGHALKCTGVEISFQILPADTEIPFLHCHKDHEEVYIFIKGNGQFQVDNDLFDITEGSIVRVAPEGRRTWRNNSYNSMVFMVIQAKAGTIENYFVNDGYGVAGKILE